MLTFTGFSVLALSLSVPQVLAVGTALGFGSATTGGGSATAAVPSSNAELLSWLADSTQVRLSIELSEISRAYQDFLLYDV